MSWLICLRFSFTRRIRVCVYVIALVWIGGGGGLSVQEADHHSTHQLETSRSWTNLSSPHPPSQHSCPTAVRISASSRPLWKAVITRASDFSFSPVHGSIALSLSISWQSWWDWSSPLTWAPHSHAFFGAIESSRASQFALVLLQHCVLLHWS